MCAWKAKLLEPNFQKMLNYALTKAYKIEFMYVRRREYSNKIFTFKNSNTIKHIHNTLFKFKTTNSNIS